MTGDTDDRLFIGMISLRTCPERRAFFGKCLPSDSDSSSTSSPSGSTKNDSTPTFLGQKVHYHVADLDPEGGVLGCTRSHMALYKKALEAGPQVTAAIIFEDDVKVNSHFTPGVIRDLLDVMDTWDVIRFHKTGICCVHGALSDHLYHTSNLCGRAYMISRSLMEYTLKFDSKEVVPYTYFLPKASARQLTYHPSLITEGAFGSWNTVGFGRAAGKSQDAAVSEKSGDAYANESSSATTSGRAAGATSPKKTSSGRAKALKGKGEAEKALKAGAEKVTKKDEGGDRALAFLQWTLKYTTVVEQAIANVHFWTNLPSPLFKPTTFPEADSLLSICRGENANADNKAGQAPGSYERLSWESYRQNVGTYEPITGICPRRLSSEGFFYFFWVQLVQRFIALVYSVLGMSASASAQVEDLSETGNDEEISEDVLALLECKGAAQQTPGEKRLLLRQKRKRTGLLLRYSDVLTSSALPNAAAGCNGAAGASTITNSSKPESPSGSSHAVDLMKTASGSLRRVISSESAAFSRTVSLDSDAGSTLDADSRTVSRTGVAGETTDGGCLYDVVVVGAGIAGSSSAYHLSQRGANVLLLEQWDVANENRRAGAKEGGPSGLESCGSSRGGPRRIGTLDLAPGTRVREAWTAWTDLRALHQKALNASGRTSDAKTLNKHAAKRAAAEQAPLLDVVGEVLVVSIFPFGWLLMIFFLIWWACRRIFAGADSLPRGLELLFTRSQVMAKLPNDAFKFDSWNVFGIYYSDAAALYTKEILKYFHAQAVPLTWEAAVVANGTMSTMSSSSGAALVEGGHLSSLPAEELALPALNEEDTISRESSGKSSGHGGNASSSTSTNSGSSTTGKSATSNDEVSPDNASSTATTNSVKSTSNKLSSSSSSSTPQSCTSTNT
ncbi:unnamed protein product, partial [Amoebophrya sp. A25]|eukprot:GSA25T00026416001.1